jgi:hypothetical protein
VGNWIIDFFNYLIAGLGWALTALVDLLPSSPIKAIDNSVVQQYLGMVNWIIPISDMEAEMLAFCAAVLIYYGIQIVMRWGKMIE